MKMINKNILIMFFFATIFSCTNQDKYEPKKNAKTDKIKQPSSNVRTINPEREITVVGDIKFSDSKVIVDEKLKHMENITISNSYGYNSYSYSLGSFSYDLMSEYDDDKLYRVKFYSRWKSAYYYDSTIKLYWQNLVDIISVQYGSKYGSYPQLSEIEEGYLSVSHEWNYGNKKIQIGTMKSDLNYCAVLWISYTPTLKIMAQRGKAYKENLIKKASEAF